jgi:hypothetical protein
MDGRLPRADDEQNHQKDVIYLKEEQLAMSRGIYSQCHHEASARNAQEVYYPGIPRVIDGALAMFGAVKEKHRWYFEEKH